MHASCILKIMAGSPAVGSIKAMSVDARIMAMGAGGMGLHATCGGLGQSPGVVKCRCLPCWVNRTKHDTHREVIVVAAAGAGGWLCDNGEGSNNGAYHPGSNNLPNRVAF